MIATNSQKLPGAFYDRPTLEVAPELLGKIITYDSNSGIMSARIVEVEAYIGRDDPACHAAKGKTDRNSVMFGPGGFVYIYFIYGMYHCLNFVTEAEGEPAAVLVRAAEAVEGIDLMRANSSGKKPCDLLNGPGKFCRSLGLSRAENGLDLTGNTIYIEERPGGRVEVEVATRVGIRLGKERLWRFYDKNSEAVSTYKR